MKRFSLADKAAETPTRRPRQSIMGRDYVKQFLPGGKAVENPAVERQRAIVKVWKLAGGSIEETDRGDVFVGDAETRQAAVDTWLALGLIEPPKPQPEKVIRERGRIQKRITGRCPVCRLRHALTIDGRLAAHKKNKRADKHCAGRGEEPLEATR